MRVRQTTQFQTKMSSFVLRCRPQGHPDIIVKLGEDSTLRELQSAVQQRTGIPPQQQIFKSGFPPTVVDILPGQRIGEVFPNRSSVIVEQGIPRREAVEDGDEKV